MGAPQTAYLVRHRLAPVSYRDLVTSVEVVLILAGVPLAIMVVLGLLTLRTMFARPRRYRPGDKWSYPRCCGRRIRRLGATAWPAGTTVADPVEPVEVLVSGIRMRGAHLIPHGLPPGMSRLSGQNRFFNGCTRRGSPDFTRCRTCPNGSGTSSTAISF